MILKEKLDTLIPVWRERVNDLLRQYGDVIVDNITVSQVYGGMRDVKSLVTDISYVDPVEGLHLRSYTIPDVLDRLPKLPHTEEPLVGGLYYLLLTGVFPTLDEALQVEEEWRQRSAVPDFVYVVLNAMPAYVSPMTMFAQAILAMQGESIFLRQYDEGIRKDRYWIPMLEDSMNLFAKLPAIASYIYHLKNKHRSNIVVDNSLDLAARFGQLLEVDKNSFADLMRLYMIIHSDHESGNVSAHTTHLVSSALSDIYYATSAAMTGLAGPLHGRANQDTLNWIYRIYDKYQGIPDREELKKYSWETINSGKVIPGYGHGVLRKTDPRFSVLMDFGDKHLPDDDLYKLVQLVYDVVPGVLREYGKVKDPWPNVDAISSTILHHYGLSDCHSGSGCGYYTVLFGVSRILGVTANVIWARALGQPIERPKSLTTQMLENIAKNSKL